MLQTTFEAALYQGRLNASVAIPANIPNAATVSIPSVSLVCPGNELWQLSFGGIVVRTDLIPLPATVVFSAAFWIQNSLSRMQTVGPSNTASVPIVLPTQIAVNAGAGEAYVSLFLSGIQAQTGDNIFGQVYITNNSGGAFNVTDFNGGIRLLPMRLVSELAVAGLQAQRQDQLLDLRLRNTRG